MIIIEDEPIVRLWTDAPVNSPIARQWLNNILDGHQGINEILEVSVATDYIIVALDPDTVTTGDEAKKVARHFMKLIEAQAEELSEWDLERWKNAATPVDFAHAMAVSSDGTED